MGCIAGQLLISDKSPSKKMQVSGCGRCHCDDRWLRTKRIHSYLLNVFLRAPLYWPARLGAAGTGAMLLVD